MYEERPGRLSSVVVWRSESAGETRVLPDGCMDIIWMDGDLFVAGPDTTVHAHEAPPGHVAVGLRFAPGALPELLGVPAAELVDTRFALRSLWGRSVVDPLVEGLHSSFDASGELESAVLALPAVANRGHGELRSPLVVDLVGRIGAGERVAEIASDVGLSERHLRRRCAESFGYGPSTLRRVLRMQSALVAARRGDPLASVAATCGYSDQAHLSRDVRSLAGVSMSALLAA